VIFSLKIKNRLWTAETSRLTSCYKPM